MVRINLFWLANTYERNKLRKSLAQIHGMAGKPARQARRRRGGRVILSASAKTQRQGGISRRAYSGSGIFRHRRGRRSFDRLAAHAAGAGPVWLVGWVPRH